MGIRAGSVHLECDDDITTSDGDDGVVIGIDPDVFVVSFVRYNNSVRRVQVTQIATVNQQDTRPRTGKLDPPVAS